MREKKFAPGRHSELSDKPFPPALYELYPPSMRVDVDKKTGATIPTEDAVVDSKHWVDYNIK